jgi:hypothetical protein
MGIAVDKIDGSSIFMAPQPLCSPQNGIVSVYTLKMTRKCSEIKVSWLALRSIATLWSLSIANESSKF